MSIREASCVFGLHRDTMHKMQAYSVASFDALNAYLERRCLERMDAWPPERQLFSYTFALPTNSRKYLNDLKAGKTPRRRPAESENTPTPKGVKKRATQIGTTDEKSVKQPRTKQTAEDRRNYDKDRNQTAERKAYQRRQRRKQVQTAKETGKCRDCPNPAILGQTKCQTCAEKHRQRRRKSDAARRARAKAQRELGRQLGDSPP